MFVNISCEEILDWRQISYIFVEMKVWGSSRGLGLRKIQRKVNKVVIHNFIAKIIHLRNTFCKNWGQIANSSLSLFFSRQYDTVDDQHKNPNDNDKDHLIGYRLVQVVTSWQAACEDQGRGQPWCPLFQDVFVLFDRIIYL